MLERYKPQVLWKEIKSVYTEIWFDVRFFWGTRGGFQSIITSPFFHLALLLHVLTYDIWSSLQWWELPISVLPALMGFTLGGYAILLAFGDTDFLARLAGNLDENRFTDENPSGRSFYLVSSSVFLHFIMLQASALLLAIIAKALSGACIFWYDVVFWSFCFLVFLYALTTTLAAGLTIFKITMWFDDRQTAKIWREQDKSDGEGDSRH